MLNIANKDIEKTIKNVIIKEKNTINNSDGMCKVAANFIYNDLLDEHIIARIVNTNELGSGYEHEFVIVKDKNDYFLIDITYNQFLNKGTILNQQLLVQNYIKVDNLILLNYLNSIPNFYKIDYINIEEIFFKQEERKRKK